MRVRTRGLGEWLKERRKLARMSQRDVAIKMGYTSPQFISNIERELAQPSLELAIALCTMYRVSKAELLTAVTESVRKQIFAKGA